MSTNFLLGQTNLLHADIIGFAIPCTISYHTPNFSGNSHVQVIFKDNESRRGMTEDEMVGWHHRRYDHVFEWALGVGDGQGSLVCCSP